MSWWIHDVDQNHKVLFEGFKRPIWELFHKYIMFASFVVIKVNTRNLVIYFPQSDLIWNYLEGEGGELTRTCHMYDLMYNRCLDEYYATVYVVCMYNRCLDDILFYCTLYVCIIDV